jgi:hypothetical protein
LCIQLSIAPNCRPLHPISKAAENVIRWLLRSLGESALGDDTVMTYAKNKDNKDQQALWSKRL